jgi:hypothetical protein
MCKKISEINGNYYFYLRLAIYIFLGISNETVSNAEVIYRKMREVKVIDCGGWQAQGLFKGSLALLFMVQSKKTTEYLNAAGTLNWIPLR